MNYMEQQSDGSYTDDNYSKAPSKVVEEKVEAREHHPYSPSTLQSLEACPCYQSVQSEHVRTIAGAIAHGATESRADDLRLDDEDAAAVAECLDFYDRRLSMAKDARLQELIKPTHNGPIGEIIELKESYLPVDDSQIPETVIDFLTGEKTTRTVKALTAGYIDAAIVMHDGTYAEIFDWKFGMWAVEKADNNLQGIAYALGMFHKFPKLEQVRFWFKQPHLDGIAERLVTRAEISKLYLRIQVVVAKAKEARKSGSFALARPMVPNCNFCANVGACDKVTAFACNVGSKFHPLEIPADITPSKIHDPKNTKLLIMLAQVMGVWAKAARSQITDRVLRGAQPVPEGFKITSKADREVIDPKKFKEVSLKHMTPEEYESACSVTFGAVEKIVGDKSPRGSKAANIREFQKSLEDSGAVKKGDSYSFLKAESTKEDSEKTQTK
jgi:hypothetical protein